MILFYPPKEHENATNDCGEHHAGPHATATLLVDSNRQDGEYEGSHSRAREDRCGERCHGRTPPNSRSCDSSGRCGARATGA